MKIAVLADIHGNHIALETCIHEAKKHGAEEYLFLGDYLGELAYPEKTMSILEQMKKEFPCTFIRGIKKTTGSNINVERTVTGSGVPEAAAPAY